MEKKEQRNKGNTKNEIDDRLIPWNGNMYRTIPPPRKYQYPSTPERRRKLALYMQDYRNKKHALAATALPPAPIDVPLPETNDLVREKLRDFLSDGISV